MANKKKNSKPKLSISDIGYILVFLLTIVVWLEIPIKNHFLDNNSLKTTAHINRDKHSVGNSKVITERSFTCGYEFELNGKMYYGNSREHNLPYGYPIEVEYVSFFPYWNRVKK